MSGQRFSLFQGDPGRENDLKKWHSPYVEFMRDSKVVLDVGCGPGYFLDLMREAGAKTVGIDLDPSMVAQARERGHEAHVGDQRLIERWTGAFDGIHLSHIIEHMWGEEALAMLEAATAALQPGGLLVVRTPNWGNETVRHGGFWMDHTHKRPYPLDLLKKFFDDLDLETITSGQEPMGWEDTYIVGRKARAATSARGLPTVVVEGDFIAPHSSLSTVNRGLFSAIARRSKFDLALLAEPSNKPIPGPAASVLEPLRSRRIDSPDILIRHFFPAATSVLAHKCYVHVQPWEFGALPKRWVAEWRDNVDEVWCYSSFVAQEYLRAGFPPERVKVVPLGFDPAVYSPRQSRRTIPTERRCVFLFVGGTIVRKGIDVLLAAWERAFKPTDDVALVIKDVPWYSPRPTKKIMDLASRTDLAELLYTEEVFPSEEAMAALYRSVSCLVHPYRGEGFGLPVLEAMACGIPAIVTKGGATDDFFTAESGYPIDAVRTAPWPTPNEEMVDEGFLLEPDVAQVAAAMRSVYEDPEGARRRGQHAAAHALGWTWEHSARRAEERLDALASAAKTKLSRAISLDQYPSALNRFEAKRYSQNGEDGIITEIFRHLQPQLRFFVEFGVQSGTECNSRDLVVGYGWSGVMIEGDPNEYRGLTETYAKHPSVKTVQAFITRENVIDVFSRAAVPKEFDVLSIDIDGNDYWVWKALGAVYRPSLVIIEVNGMHPPPERWVMEYNPAHTWQHDNYYGASLQSLSDLGKSMGYSLIGVESAGVNAFFLRTELLERSGFPALTPAIAYRKPRHVFPERVGPFVEI